MTFAEALSEHLDAIAARDLGRFAATLARSPEVRVVGPDGSAIAGHDAILDAHRGWFAAPEPWTFEPDVLIARDGGDLGFALLDVRYADGGGPRRFYLTLVFVREGGTWRLLYDQNTTIASGTLEAVG
jgi:ketosteroid isomerase-like protein